MPPKEYFDELFRWQDGLLRALGIASRPNEDNCVIKRPQGNIIRHLTRKLSALVTASVGVVILFGSLGLTCLRTAASLYEMASVMSVLLIPTSISNSSRSKYQHDSLAMDLLKTLSKLPTSSVRLRGSLIFLILYWQRDKWKNLRVTFNNAAHLICPNGRDELSLVKKWRKRSPV